MKTDRKIKSGSFIKNYFKEILIGLFTGVLNGLFGAGGGSIVVPAMEKFLKIDEKKSHSTAIAIILMMSIVSSITYIFNGFFNLKLWSLVSAGGIFGGFVGARLLNIIPKKWLKILFGGVIIATAIKMIL